MKSEHADPIHKVTIIPRGMALGVTLSMPAEDRYGLSREEINAQICKAMGGRAAEELVFNRFTTGAANDLKQATELARAMVSSYGMSDRIGPVCFTDDDHDVFLGRDFAQQKSYSADKAKEIDDEITRILIAQYDVAKQILEDNRDTLERITEALLERETLDSVELKLLVAGEELPPLPPIAGTEPKSDPPPERAPAKPSEGFSGDKLPDPEPVPG